MPPPSAPSPLLSRHPLAFPVLLFVLVFALFSPTVRYPLVGLDDFAYINQNRIVGQGLTPANVRAAFSPSNASATMYMPVLWISYMADVTLLRASPEHPAPFHAVNVALHAVSAVLLFFLLRRLRAAPPWAFSLALLWAVHPLRVESVAWVAERKDVLSAALGLAATLVWLASAGRRRFSRALWLGSAAVLYAVGLLAKPSLAPLPLAWMALDVWPLRRIPPPPRATGFLRAIRQSVWEKLLFLPLAAMAAWGAVARHHAVSGALAVPWSCRLAAVAPNFLFYLRKTLLPVGLAPLVPERWLFPPAAVLLSLAVCAAMAAAVWRFRRAVPSLLPGVAWMLLFFLPASGLQPLPMNTVADRFFYLPSIGLSFACAALPSALSGRFGRVLHGAVAVLLLALAAVSLRILPNWSSPRALYSRVAEVFPAHPFAASELASIAVKSSGDFDAAEALLAPALARHPEAWSLRFAQADCLLRRDSPAAAIDFLLRSHPPEDRYTAASMFFLLANYEYFRGGFPAAVDYASRAIPLYPENSTGRLPAIALAMAAAFDAGDQPLALSFARQTRSRADTSSVHLGDLLPLAIFHWFCGYREQAGALFFRILDAYPSDTALWNNVLWGLATADWSPVPPEIVLSRTIRMQAESPVPDHPGILDTLAAALANAGDFPAALDAIGQAIAQLPDAPGDAFRAKLLARRALYAQNLPYRENAFDRIYSAAFGAPADAL